ncbi:glycosyltransferase [uncultured Thiothrix sp.]|uniref:glycosyltransferase n=1 Tax=uncultured Thiothrix sp. TaxID=223185 RepID=UPI00262C3294|nr:glycosyltransferase [uncultured Thiothrix sp.]
MIFFRKKYISFLKNINQSTQDNFIKKVFFHRDFLRFQGGHLKVWNYFNHLKSTQDYLPEIYFSPSSIHDSNNPWQFTSKLKEWSPGLADILFLAGLDWQSVLNNKLYVEKRSKIPVINLIQGLSHADPQDIKYPFLSKRAIRICVSNQVESAISSTGKVNGPIFTIPNGVDLDNLPMPLSSSQKDIELLIVAIKKPQLGHEIEKYLKGKYKVVLTISSLLPRNDFINILNRARLVVCLPHFVEGFYLPALEAMALGCIVICPDCIGNRSFCLDQQTCFLPKYDIGSIIEAIDQVGLLNSQQHKALLENATKQVKIHSLEQEREQFLAIMKNLSNIW